MPSKAKKKAATESKKSAQKKKEKLVEDKTFGMKNKNKSKKVQAKIQSIERNVMNSGDPKQRKLDEQRKKQKADMKARKKAAKEEQDALFGEALMAVKKKTTTKLKGGTVEAKGRDHDDDEGKKSGTSRAMKMMYQMDAKEVADQLKDDPNYIRTIEDEIEEQRAKMFQDLKKSGKKGTPVTPETFAAWQERKRKKKAEESRKLVEAEMKKKKGGKGLAVLTGRALYEYKKELFVDDNDDDVMGVDLDGDEKKKVDENGENGVDVDDVEKDVVGVTEKIQSDLFLEGDDDDLDDLDDLDDD